MASGLYKMGENGCGIGCAVVHKHPNSSFREEPRWRVEILAMSPVPTEETPERPDAKHEAGVV